MLSESNIPTTKLLWWLITCIYLAGLRSPVVWSNPSLDVSVKVVCRYDICNMSTLFLIFYLYSADFR